MSKREWTTIKEYEDIRFEFFEGIAKITIDRQEVYNAFRPQTNFEMLDAINICRERSDIGVVVLTGAGDKAFCSGGDQKVKGIGGYKTAYLASTCSTCTRPSVLSRNPSSPW